MNITVIGWYGTETIGDRAILAGIFSFFSNTYSSFEIQLGSLNPFFSERTINEDCDFWRDIDCCPSKISIFNSKSATALTLAMQKTDLVVMGGGPLMHINEIYMVEFAFKKARKLRKKTALLGCGIGPLFTQKSKKSVVEIVKFSDLVILRDSVAENNLREIFLENNVTYDADDIHTSYDPAVQCALSFGQIHRQEIQSYVAVNLRKFPAEYSKVKMDVNAELIDCVRMLSERNEGSSINLIPMHYFHIGGDDREVLNDIVLTLGLSNVSVQNVPLSLKETLEIYANARFNVGMRFHAIVLQTIVSGKNYILDYTEPKKGKIYGFIKDVDEFEFYKDKYVALQSGGLLGEFERKIATNNISDMFKLNKLKVNEKLLIYNKKLLGLME